jgi:ubiquinone/menaquinone biosynthesis C-methylase UbiE
MTRLTIQYIISRQLSKPGGIIGKIVAALMAAGNKQMYDYVLRNSGEIGQKVLEIGFGGGSHFQKILEQTKEGTITGIDKSKSMVNLASRNNNNLIDNNRLFLSQGDSCSLPYPDEEFDTVISLNTIYFWREPQLDIDQIYRVLSSGGRLLIGFNSKDIMIRNGYKKKYFNFYEPDEVEKLILKAGFNNIIHSYEKLRIEDCHLFIASK